MNLWQTLLYQPLVNLLILFYQILGHNLGLAIIALTVAVRGALLPLTLPSLKSAQKMKGLGPQLSKLKKKYKDDRQGLAKAQLQLYQKHGINPAAGCLPQILQLIVLAALFQAFNQVLRPNGDVGLKLNQVLYPYLQLSEGQQINARFLYFDLTQPDLITLPFQFNLLKISFNKIPGLLLILAATAQFFASKYMMSSAKGAVAQAQKTPQPEDDVAAAMQKQMLYIMPVMTLLIGFRFPSGLVLYLLTFSFFMFGQQYFMQRSLGKKGKSK